MVASQNMGNPFSQDPSFRGGSSRESSSERVTSGGGGGMIEFEERERRPSKRKSKDSMRRSRGNSTESTAGSESSVRFGFKRKPISRGDAEDNSPMTVDGKAYKSPRIALVARQVRAYEATRAKAPGNEKIGWYIIDPRSSNAIGHWDAVTSIALIFTAIFTPFEVGFVEPPEDKWDDPLFLLNRVVDTIFIIDMTLQFFLMYSAVDNNHPAGETWISDPKKIAMHYLTSAWFPIDVVSIGVAFFDIFAPSSGAISRFKGFRAIRVLRLIKLVRLVNASRIFKRWELRLSVNYAKLSLAQVIFGLIFTCHLFACLWGLQASFDPLGTWPGTKEYCVPFDWASETCPEGKVCSQSGHACEQPETMYLYSVYWSIATITSIGYGDVAATPFATGEQIICTLMMLLGAVLFAQLVGSFCGLASALSPGKAQFRFDLSDLNAVMEAEAVPSGLRFRLREYMHQTTHLRQAATRQRILGLLSPGIGGELALNMNEKWLASVWFLPPPQASIDNRRLHLALARLLDAQVFAPGESCPSGKLYIVSKGRALYAGHVYKLGQSWGSDEALIEEDHLRYKFHAIASGYLWTYTIGGEVLRSVIRDHPGPAKILRRHQTRRVVQRGMVRAAEEELQARGERSFHGRLNFLLARDPAEVRAANRNARRMSAMLDRGVSSDEMLLDAASNPNTPGARRNMSISPNSIGFGALSELGESSRLQDELGKTQKEQAAKLAAVDAKVEAMRKDMAEMLALLKSQQLTSISSPPTASKPRRATSFQRTFSNKHGGDAAYLA